MDEQRPPGEVTRKPSMQPKRRIETQIHRRKKAKAVSPLEPEWDATSGARPVGLRMPPENMRKTGQAG